ncbi:hypothetical protein [Halocatena marina]|uniref:hypothetical protein n=1 Tax=Halocatena marina TaxID=2934937 RepID=UPI00200BFB59|nr:hypothetical protein [Halocatena marina]
MATTSPNVLRTVPRDRISLVPAYDSAEQKALDTTLVTAMERAKAAEEAVLAHVFRCDVGSERYQEYGDKPDRMKLAL